jgi:hypothetical protein
VTLFSLKATQFLALVLALAVVILGFIRFEGQLLAEHRLMFDLNHGVSVTRNSPSGSLKAQVCPEQK